VLERAYYLVVDELTGRRLVIRPGAIGDFIVSLPAIECLRAGYLEVWTATDNVPLVRFADRAVSISSTGLDTLGYFGTDVPVVRRLRSFDSIVSWYGANRPEFRRLCGELGLPVQFLPALPPEGCGVHAVEFYLEQARSITHRACSGLPRIECAARREKFAVIHPFSGSPKKNWPIDRYRELAQRLEKLLPVKWCAGPEEELPGAVRIENLYDLACWLSSASLYVGNDSGITHLAAAAGAPVVAIFGASDPNVWAPSGPNVEVVSASSLQAIQVNSVYARISRLL